MGAVCPHLSNIVYYHSDKCHTYTGTTTSRYHELKISHNYQMHIHYDIIVPPSYKDRLEVKLNPHNYGNTTVIFVRTVSNKNTIMITISINLVLCLPFGNDLNFAYVRYTTISSNINKIIKIITTLNFMCTDYRLYFLVHQFRLIYY